MKAVRRCDGKVIDVIEFSPREFIETVDQTGDGRKIYPEGQLVLVENVDWDAYRRETAGRVLAGFASKIGHQMSDYAEQSCKYAVALTDELIRQLKK